jgi:Ricin-type beta-trefoil lectin domain
MRQVLLTLIVIAAMTPWAPAFALFTGNSDAFHTGAPVLIPICWTNADDEDANNVAARRELQDAVESEWQRFARVNFTHFEPCLTVPSVRRIEVTFRPTQGGGQCPWTPDPKATDECWIGISCVSDGNASCIRLTVLHEIGHALGYYHEEERLDYNHAAFWGTTMPHLLCASQDWCSPDNPNPETCPNQLMLGGYDPGSVMSYCQPGAKLSPNDIFAHQHVYGFRTPNTIMSTRGSCLSVNFGIDNFAFAWDCDEAAGQKWRRSLDGRIRSQENTSLCLGFKGRGANGARVEAVNCHARNTRWDLERLELRGLAGKCLTLHNGQTTNGNALVMAECNDSPWQRWSISRIGEIKSGRFWDFFDGAVVDDSHDARFEPHEYDERLRWDLEQHHTVRPTAALHQLRAERLDLDLDELLLDHGSHRRHGKCVTVVEGETANGTKLEIRDCDHRASQRFLFTENNIRFGGKCVDVPAWRDADYWPEGTVGTDTNRNLPGDGAQLQMWDCLSEQFNQKFWFSGSLSAHGRCLDLDKGNPNNGTKIQTWDCLENTNQQWDIFF